MSKKIFQSLFVILMLLLAGILQAQGTDPGTDDLTHSWTFDDGTAYDAVGGVLGTVVGEPEFSNGALKLLAEGDYIELDGYAIELEYYDAITVEAWFKPQAGANTGYTMLWYFGDQNASGQGSYGFFYSPARGDDKSRTAISITDTDPWTAESGADGPEIDDGIVHHAVCIIDEFQIGYYLDGELQDTVALSESNFIGGISPNYAWIGRGGYDPDPSYIGTVYEVNIYAKAVTADEVEFMFADMPDEIGDPNAGNSELEDITVSVGELNFIPGVTTYAVAIPKLTATVNVTGTVKYEGSTIISGEGDVDVSSGTGSTTLVVVSSNTEDTTDYVVDFVALDPKLSGDFIGHDSSWGGDPTHLIDAAFDGDVTTFVDAPTAEGFVGLDLGDTLNAILTAVRYAPRSGYADRMVGGKIMGANSADLSDADTIFTITEEPPVNYMTVAMIDSAGPYRYIYYYSADGYCNITELEFFSPDAPVSIKIKSNDSYIPAVYTLGQNYPNPFNPETNIRFSLPKASQTTLKVYNTLGQLVATLVDEKMHAGAHTVTFNALTLPSGIYFYCIQSGDFVQVKKMALLK